MGFLSIIPRWKGKYARCKDIKTLRPADHIAIWDFSRFPLRYQHHGIVWTSGDDVDSIKVCHIWSPLEGYQEAQADSCFRISPLRDFLYNRNAKYLRVVEYHTSGLRELLSEFGEVHFTKSDIPEVVLARCKFLMGLGRGEFNIFTQNCEHAAHWCKTGQNWCKQNLTTGKGSVPFETQSSKDQVEALNTQITAIKESATREVERILALSESMVYVRVNGSHYLDVTTSKQVRLTAQEFGTPFRIFCYAKGYNCVKVSLFHEASGCYMYSRSTMSCFRDVRMKRKNRCRGTSGLKWEFSSVGVLVSMNQHRRYLGVRDDGLLVDVSLRGEAARFELVPAEKLTETIPDNRVTLPDVREPSLSPSQMEAAILKSQKSELADVQEHSIAIEEVNIQHTKK